jgi:hypothetical protein
MRDDDAIQNNQCGGTQRTAIIRRGGRNAVDGGTVGFAGTIIITGPELRSAANKPGLLLLLLLLLPAAAAVRPGQLPYRSEQRRQRLPPIVAAGLVRLQ